MDSDNLSSAQFGQYTLRELIGVGGMGAVYLADQPGLKRRVAIKVLNSSSVTDPDYAERFAREAQMAAALEHPHIVPVYDHGTTPEGISYVVMRLLNGGSLAQRLDQLKKRSETLPSLTETAKLLRQMASALDYAHSKNVIHRDIKPNNIMFDEQGNSYLVDFGIARLLADQTTSGTLTQTGMMVGTPAYMPPEIWRGEDWSRAADQYALGIVVYEMVSGRPPFVAQTLYQLISQHLNEIPEPPNYEREEVPDAVTPVLQRVLGKEPDDRYASIGEFASAFEDAIKRAEPEHTTTGFFQMPLEVDEHTKLLTSTPRNLLLTMPTTAGTPIPIVPPPRNNRPLIIGGFIGLLVIVALGLLAFQSSNSQATLQATLVALEANQSVIAPDMMTATAVTCIANIAPTQDGGGGEIAFHSDRDGDSDIYLMNADGTNVRRLTDSEGEDLNPTWSPDGNKLAFISDRDGNNEIYLLIASPENRAEFTSLRLTQNSVDDAEPRWSPDGNHVVFASRLEGSWDIYMVDADGNNLRRLTDHAASDETPVWSPDGTQIAFSSDRDGNYEIYVIDSNGSNVRRLTNDAANDGNTLVWSPDGSRIAFVSILPDSNWEIDTVAPNDPASVINFSNRGGDEWHPKWSPDGRSLAYLWQTDNVEIVVTGADGSNRRNITAASSDDWTYSWSPDSSYIAFESDREGNWELLILDTCGGNLRRLTNNSADDLYPAWRP
ncbi:MAG: serine/threonine-protein kinase [Anaerolineae bacterium]|nr:serine/threonine-protein kinase [Anaerolineae bacterium]